MATLFNEGVPASWKNAIRTFCLWQCSSAEYGPITLPHPPMSTMARDLESQMPTTSSRRDPFLIAARAIDASVAFTQEMSIVIAADDEDAAGDSEDDDWQAHNHNFSHLPGTLSFWMWQLPMQGSDSLHWVCADELQPRRRLAMTLSATFLDLDRALASVPLKSGIRVMLQQNVEGIQDFFVKDVFAVEVGDKSSRVRGVFFRKVDVHIGFTTSWHVIAVLDDRLVEVDLSITTGVLNQESSTWELHMEVLLLHHVNSCLSHDACPALSSSM